MTCITRVNDEPVNDGTKGCDRAALLFKCSVDKAPEALTEEEIKVEFTKLVMKCTKDHPVEMSELMQLQKLIVPKKTEMTSKGLYDIEHAYKMAEMTKNGDEKRLVNARKLSDVCVKVWLQSLNQLATGQILL
ncbi:Odorant binding protein, partial [Operophtera brumata]